MLYQFTVPNMDYLVTLYFADPTYGSPNQRLFQVQLNGASNSVLSSVDVAANSGGHSAYRCHPAAKRFEPS